MEVLYGIAGIVYRFLQSGPEFPAAWLYALPAGVVVVLLHELGHALAAQERLDTDVEVSVGDTGKIAELQLGQITASVNVWSQLGPVAGMAEFDDSRATARDILWIALAGPRVSFVAFLLGVLVVSQIPSEGIVRNFLHMTTLANLLCALNVIPLELKKRGGKISFRSDGRLALDAFKVVRELR